MKGIFLRLLLIAALPLLGTNFCLHAQLTKNKLRVLYVGGSGNFNDDQYKSKEARETDIKQRMASFENMLKKYFEYVTVIHARDYEIGFSAQYDVTVMDGVPASKAYAANLDLKQLSDLYAEQVNILPDDFSEPVLFIGQRGYNLGRKIGLKFNWLCQCLGDEAYNMNLQHEIFKKPFPVQISTSPQALPTLAAVKNYREDKLFPAIVPMWKVQTKSYDNSPGFRPGLISEFGGFEDSPEAEYISGGTSSKGDANAVALGRHGSFFHWGFSASPQYLTPEAEAVLANAIVYISRFGGNKIIARKFKDWIKNSYDIIGKKSMATEKAYALHNAYEKKIANQQDSMFKAIQAKKQKGETLSEEERFLLKEGITASAKMSMESWLKSTQGKLFDTFGTNLSAYQKYYGENLHYFYSDVHGKLTVDEDLKNLQIKNKDPKLLDAAISLWETGTAIEKGKRILNKYTLATFTEPRQWRKWYEVNKSRFFFTESGGYYFLINTQDNVEGNNYRKKREAIAYDQLIPEVTTDEKPVSIAVSSVSLDNGNKEVVLKLKIHPGYHLYNHVSDIDPYIPTEINLSFPPGYKKVGALKHSAAIPYNLNNTSVFKDEAIFVQEFAPAKEGIFKGDLSCEVTYQACDEDKCYPPVTTQFKVKM